VGLLSVRCYIINFIKLVFLTIKNVSGRKLVFHCGLNLKLHARTKKPNLGLNNSLLKNTDVVQLQEKATQRHVEALYRYYRRYHSYSRATDVVTFIAVSGQLSDCFENRQKNPRVNGSATDVSPVVLPLQTIAADISKV